MVFKPKLALGEQNTADAVKKTDISLKTEGDSGAKYNPYDEVIERLSRMEQENATMKQQLAEKDDNAFTKRRAKYEWPNWKYSYKTWEGKPITSYETVEMKQVRDYSKPSIRYDTIHILDITLADGSVKRLDYDTFSQGYGKSEKIFVDEIRTIKGKKLYKFNVEGETFEVAENIIN